MFSSFNILLLKKLILEGDFKRMITTLTMNPSIDYRFNVDEINLGEVNRIRLLKKEAAGKGINVAKYLNKWGLAVKALFCPGDINGQYMVDQLQKKRN